MILAPWKFDVHKNSIFALVASLLGQRYNVNKASDVSAADW